MNIKVAIFEDNALLRDSLFQLVNGSEGFVCTGAFADCTDLMRKVESANPDVILMDIDLPGGMNGIEAVGRINQTHVQHVDVPCRRYASLYQGEWLFGSPSRASPCRDIARKQALGVVPRPWKGSWRRLGKPDTQRRTFARDAHDAHGTAQGLGAELHA